MRPSSTRSIEALARRELQARSRAAVIGLALLAIPSILFVVAPLFLLLAAVVHWALARRLERDGLLVPATVTDSSGKAARFEDASEAWGREGDALQHLDDDDVAEAFGLAHQITLVLGRFVPATIVHYRFELGGRRFRVGKYMFTGERFHADEEGRAWALVDPALPRINHWIVSSRPVGSS